MKVKIFVLWAMLITTSATFGQVSFLVRAGINFQNLNGELESGDKMDNKLKVGLFVGAEAEIPIVPDFWFQPGLLFSSKGAGSFGELDKASLSYIELPLHLLYKPVLGDGRLIIGLGPYLAYAVSGNYQLNGGKEDITFTNDIEEGDLGYFLKPFDSGADIIFGYELSMGFSAQFHAQLGLVNLSPSFEGEKSDAVIKNTGFGLSVAYKF